MRIARARAPRRDGTFPARRARSISGRRHLIRKGDMKKRPITHEPLAAQPFKLVPEFANLDSKPTVMERQERQLHDITAASRMAIHLLGLPKSEVVRILRSMVAEDNNAKSADEMLRTLVTGREMAQVLVKVIEAAETRFARTSSIRTAGARHCALSDLSPLRRRAMGRRGGGSPSGAIVSNEFPACVFNQIQT
jgi:hypothetical protein